MTTAPSAPWLQMWSRCRLTAQRVKVGEMVSRGDPVGKGGYWCLNLVDLMVKSIKSCALLDICWGTVTHTYLSEAFIAHSAQLRLHLRVCVSGPDGDRRLPEGSSRHNGWRRLSFEKIIDRSKFVPVFARDTVWTDVASVRGPLLTCVLKTQKCCVGWCLFRDQEGRCGEWLVWIVVKHNGLTVTKQTYCWCVLIGWLWSYNKRFLLISLVSNDSK